MRRRRTKVQRTVNNVFQSRCHFFPGKQSWEKPSIPLSGCLRRLAFIRTNSTGSLEISLNEKIVTKLPPFECNYGIKWMQYLFKSSLRPSLSRECVRHAVHFMDFIGAFKAERLNASYLILKLLFHSGFWFLCRTCQTFWSANTQKLFWRENKLVFVKTFFFFMTEVTNGHKDQQISLIFILLRSSSWRNLQVSCWTCGVKRLKSADLRV